MLAGSLYEVFVYFVTCCIDLSQNDIKLYELKGGGGRSALISCIGITIIVHYSGIILVHCQLSYTLTVECSI